MVIFYNCCFTLLIFFVFVVVFVFVWLFSDCQGHCLSIPYLHLISSPNTAKLNLVIACKFPKREQAFKRISLPHPSLVGLDYKCAWCWISVEGLQKNKKLKLLTWYQEWSWCLNDTPTIHFVIPFNLQIITLSEVF